MSFGLPNPLTSPLDHINKIETEKKNNKVEKTIEKLNKIIDKDNQKLNYYQQLLISIESSEDIVAIPIDNKPMYRVDAILYLHDKIQQLQDTIGKAIDRITKEENLVEVMPSTDIDRFIEFIASPVENTEEAIDNTVMEVEETVDNVIETVDNVIDDIEDTLEDTFDNVKDGIENTYDNIVGGLEDVGIGFIAIVAIGGYLLYRNRDTIKAFVPDNVSVDVL